MSSTELVGLQSLAQAYRSSTHVSISCVDLAYLVRQLHIGHGCINGCLHCFADPPTRLEQMHLSSFRRLAHEFGQAAEGRHTVFPFLFLGASSDPAMIADFAAYAETWITSLPPWHPVKFFTHGWLLSDAAQRRELSAFCDVAKAHRCRVKPLALSVDLFSRLARRDRALYIDNAAGNLRAFAAAVPAESLKLEVTYPPSRLDAESIYTMEHWRSVASAAGALPSDLDTILSRASSPGDREVSELTSTVFAIADKAGLDRCTAARISRDAGAAFPGGRASRWYAGANSGDASRAIAGQKEHALYRLTKADEGYNGLVLMPNGSARLVDYLGYRLGPWLSDGTPVVPYISSYTRDDAPWSLPDDAQFFERHT